MVYVSNETYRCGKGNLIRQSNTRKYLNPYSDLLDETVLTVSFVANFRGRGVNMLPISTKLTLKI